MASPYYSRFIKTPALRSRGVMFDKFINMNGHVTTVCRAAYYILSLKAFL